MISLNIEGDYMIKKILFLLLFIVFVTQTANAQFTISDIKRTDPDKPVRMKNPFGLSLDLWIAPGSNHNEVLPFISFNYFFTPHINFKASSLLFFNFIGLRLYALKTELSLFAGGYIGVALGVADSKTTTLGGIEFGFDYMHKSGFNMGLSVMIINKKDSSDLDNILLSVKLLGVNW